MPRLFRQPSCASRSPFEEPTESRAPRALIPIQLQLLDVVRTNSSGSVHNRPHKAMCRLIGFRQKNKITEHHAEKKPDPGNKKVARSFHTSLMLPLFPFRKPNPRGRRDAV